MALEYVDPVQPALVSNEPAHIYLTKKQEEIPSSTSIFRIVP